VALSLSGGIDSSAIATMCTRVGAKNLVALTVGYPNADKVDERKYAQALSKKLGLTYHEEELDDSSVVDNFPKMVWACDDPIAEIGMFNIYEIYRLTHQRGIKVLLTGVGGDELFWGYPWVSQAAQLSVAKFQQNKKNHSNWLSQHIPDWAMPLWVIGTIAYFHTLQYIIRPHRLFASCFRLLKGSPVSSTEAIIYGLYIKFFKRKETRVKEVERIERVDLPVAGIPRRQSDDPAILINSGNPARGLI
jgi:hypothetical protein